VKAHLPAGKRASEKERQRHADDPIIPQDLGLNGPMPAVPYARPRRGKALKFDAIAGMMAPILFLTGSINNSAILAVPDIRDWVP